MKRGTREHPKFKALHALLGVDEAYTVGVLESLWMTVEEFLDNGAIGRWSDLRIAKAIGWGLDARLLVDALKGSEFVDPVDGDDRLVVHDWLSHCRPSIWVRWRDHIEMGKPVPAWLHRQYQKACKERDDVQKLLTNGSSWRSIRANVLQDDCYTCQYCGKRGHQVDHVHPRSRGGTNARPNLVTACKACNTKKGSRTLKEVRMRLIGGPSRG